MGAEVKLSPIQLVKLYPNQILSSININVGSFVVGISISSAAVLAARLEEGNDHLKPNDEEISWIISSLMLGTMITSFFGGQMADRLGLKGCTIVTNFIFVVAYGLIVFGHTVWLLSIGRFLLGTCVIGNRMASQPLICEISNPQIRSFTGCFWIMSYTMGQCSMYLMAAFIPWRLAIGIAIIPLAVSTVIMFLIHESPVWLLTRGEVTKAENSLRFYDRSEEDIAEEIKSMQEVMMVDHAIEGSKSWAAQWKTKLNLVAEPTFFKPCLYLMVVLTAMEWSCFPFVSSYLVSIFKASNSPIDPYITSIFATASRFVAALASGAILPKFPRRHIFLTSAVILFLCLFSLAIYFYLLALDGMTHITDYLTWVPLAAVMSIYLSSSIGFMNINLLLIGEILPAESKSLGNAMVTLAQFMASFAMVKSVPFLMDTLNLYGMFGLFSAMVALIIVFAAIFMPETQGFSLPEIQKNFEKKPRDVEGKS
eukprot:maker-scaffold580_size130538-snap-gene-0.33 protein:Tk07493 transcript:maker-scaffold580_size130538-snap-gene-0.33-mRNA-1 annotation:"sugar transporter protein 5"